MVDHRWLWRFNFPLLKGKEDFLGQPSLGLEVQLIQHREKDFLQPGWFFFASSHSPRQLGNLLHCFHLRSSSVWLRGLYPPFDFYWICTRCCLPLLGVNWLSDWGKEGVCTPWRRIEGALCSVYNEATMVMRPETKQKVDSRIILMSYKKKFSRFRSMIMRPESGFQNHTLEL